MGLHDYIIISQNKQDNSRFCTILDYHMTCSDHDKRVAKVGPAMRITELEAIIRFISRFTTHLCKKIINKFYLILHTCVQIFDMIFLGVNTHASKHLI